MSAGVCSKSFINIRLTSFYLSWLVLWEFGIPSWFGGSVRPFRFHFWVAVFQRLHRRRPVCCSIPFYSIYIRLLFIQYYSSSCVGFSPFIRIVLFFFIPCIFVFNLFYSVFFLREIFSSIIWSSCSSSTCCFITSSLFTGFSVSLNGLSSFG